MPDIKTLLIVALSIALVILSTCNSCQKAKYEKALAKAPTTKTVTKSDTTWVHDTSVQIIIHPEPYLEFKSKYKIQRVFDTLYVEGQRVGLDSVVDNYYSVKNYSDTFPSKYGYILSEQTVSENTLQSSSITPFLKIPVITNTVTNTITAKPRTQLFLGIEAQGTKQNPFDAAGITAMLKSKRGAAYQVGALYNSRQQIVYKAGILFPLTLKK